MTEQEFIASVNKEIARMTTLSKDYPEYARCDDHYDAQGRRCILHKHHDSPHLFVGPNDDESVPEPLLGIGPEPTLWDYYAMSALQGLLAGAEYQTSAVVEIACEQADAMMLARAKRRK